MQASRTVRTFRIEVRASPETNDHQVRFIADGEDVVSGFSGLIGLDPDDVFLDPAPLRGDATPKSVIVARCECGVVGCDSAAVEIARSASTVTWAWTTPSGPRRLRFAATEYDSEISRAMRDTAWESPDRTAARLLRGIVDRPRLARDGLTYSWASGRIRPNKLTVSLHLEPGPYQILVHVPWNGETPERIAAIASELLQGGPVMWPEVEYNPQAPNLGPPPLLGLRT